MNAHTQVHPGHDHLPREDHHEVHYIPAIPQVGALVENKAQSDDLDARLKAKDPNEIGLRIILRRNTKHGHLCPSVQWPCQMATNHDPKADSPYPA